jgi:hypothetical protein
LLLRLWTSRLLFLFFILCHCLCCCHIYVLVQYKLDGCRISCSRIVKCVKVTSHFSLLLGLRMHGAIRHSQHFLTVCCLKKKAQGQFNFFLLLHWGASTNVSVDSLLA